MDKLTVGLEWFLNPDHMPLILGIERGWFKEQNLEIEMIEPKEHFDALDEIEKGTMDIAITEPIHLVEDKASNQNVVGFARFLHTNGGIMYKKDKGIKTPKDLIGKRLQYPGAPGLGGIAIAKTMIEADGAQYIDGDIKPVNNSFYHTDALLNDKADAATLIFENFEILEAKTVKASEYDDDKKPSIAIIYGVKNKKDKDLTASSAFIKSFDIYQNSKDVKRRLEIGGGFDTDLKEKYEEDMDNKINKDGKVKGVMFFKLKDTKTPVTLEAKDPNHGNDEKVGTKEFKIKEN